MRDEDICELPPKLERTFGKNCEISEHCSQMWQDRGDEENGSQDSPGFPVANRHGFCAQLQDPKRKKMQMFFQHANDDDVPRMGT